MTEGNMDGPIADVSARQGKHDEHSGAVRSMFDRIASRYDLLNRVLSIGIDRRWRRAAILAVRPRPRARVLDLCAGTLDITQGLADAYPDAILTAADFSAEMLERGKHKVPAARCVVADAMALPFEDDSFDAAICAFGIRNVANTETALRELRRILSPASRFVTLEFFRSSGPMTRAFHDSFARVVLPVVGQALSGDRAAYRYLADSMATFHSRTEYEALLRSVGFSNINGYDLTFGIASVVVAEVPTPAPEGT
jgi:ubiquinone/menaquinone biosynthesis methyltransferase